MEGRLFGRVIIRRDCYAEDCVRRSSDTEVWGTELVSSTRVGPYNVKEVADNLAGSRKKGLGFLHKKKKTLLVQIPKR